MEIANKLLNINTDTILKNLYKNRIEADRILTKYPDRVPIIVTKNIYSKTTPNIDKHKFLAPLDLTMGQFMFVIRKRIKLHPNMGLFLFINNTVVCNTELVGSVYYKLHDKDDGFLHVVYSCENVFG